MTGKQTNRQKTDIESRKCGRKLDKERQANRAANRVTTIQTNLPGSSKNIGGSSARTFHSEPKIQRSDRALQKSCSVSEISLRTWCGRRLERRLATESREVWQDQGVG